MSWPAALITMAAWWAFCIAISVNGWVEGAVVGGVCFLAVVGMRLWLDLDDRRRSRRISQ